MGTAIQKNVRQLSASYLIKKVSECFDSIPDHRPDKCVIPFPNFLKSAFAMMHQKFDSLLGFDEERVNVLDYIEIDKKGIQHVWCWVTDLEVTDDTVESVMRGGRCRWRIENETFNTLKNQGYQLEHNYGHGEKHLATNFAYLTFLAFLIDQIQELSCPKFQQALNKP